MVIRWVKRTQALFYLPTAGSPDRRERTAWRGTPCLGRGATPLGGPVVLARPLRPALPEDLSVYGCRMSRIDDLEDPPSPNGKEVVTPGSRSAWRDWLASNPDRWEGVWVVYRKKSSELEGPGYDDLVEEALCFGWIDSQSRRVDGDRVIQWFSPRRKGGLWSARNKERIERLERTGLMTAAGRAMIEEAKADGSWSQTDDVDALIVPPDLEAALGSAGAKAAYEALADSVKRQYLWWISSAKRPVTRAARIAETVHRLSDGPVE